MEKPPPVENVLFVTPNEPNDVNNGITEKSPVPSAVVRELSPTNIVAVSRLRPTMETETPVKARDPLIAFARNTVGETVITAKRNKGHVEDRRFMVVHFLRESGYALRVQKPSFNLRRNTCVNTSRPLPSSSIEGGSGITGGGGGGGSVGRSGTIPLVLTRTWSRV